VQRRRRGRWEDLSPSVTHPPCNYRIVRVFGVVKRRQAAPINGSALCRPHTPWHTRPTPTRSSGIPSMPANEGRCWQRTWKRRVFHTTALLWNVLHPTVARRPTLMRWCVSKWLRGPAAFKVELAVVSPCRRHRHNLESFHQPLNQPWSPSPVSSHWYRVQYGICSCNSREQIMKRHWDHIDHNVAWVDEVGPP